uniref:Putative LAGLIDADG homing endonuclease n=1 Tax=Sykidion marinum TaxID=44573 RepID=A0A1W6EGM9_SYKMA|nr:putative LAGLIDADG homing endonuclease [Pseudoneochloris marina]ARK14539.1 putative LAGLIDADG homing endonuclease [Pseudoneochloris marina]
MTQLESQWITGFVDGEGCFFVGINKNSKMTTGFQVLPEFVIVQHKDDEQILHALKSFWGFGVVRKNNGDRQCYRVRSFTHLQNKIIPFFEKHKLKTKKNLDFLKFRKILLMIERKQHLTVEGLLKIDSIRLQMNQSDSKKPRKKLLLVDDKLVFDYDLSKIESSLS